MSVGLQRPFSLLHFGATTVRDAERAVLLEWLETNGLGDFACGTAAGPMTRRSHGLFTLASGPGGRPMLLLAGLDEHVERAEERLPLSCHQYVDARSPTGHESLTQFSASPIPEWRHEIFGAALSRRIFMPRGKRIVVIAWSLSEGAASGPWGLRVRPLFAYRDADALTQENTAVDMAVGHAAGSLRLTPYVGCPEFHLRHSSGEAQPVGCWYRRFRHSHDIVQGRDGDEDLFSPCEMRLSLNPGSTAWLVAGPEPFQGDVEALERSELARRGQLTLFDLEDDATASILAHAAEAFPKGERQITAAYPVPREDLRFALIALPGVLLCTRKLGSAKLFLRDAIQTLHNTPVLSDEALWFARAAELYVDHTRDWDFLRDELTPACDALAGRYLQDESSAGFRLAPDGLLSSETDSPLTWMDACVNDWAITPRRGKPVEVNALWHHMLTLVTRWHSRRDEMAKARHYASLRELCAKSFRRRYWNEATHCLNDVIDTPAGEPDPSIRPNQLFAIALPGDLLDRHQAIGILSVVERRLLTPRGLATLSLEDPAFRPRIEGSPTERTAAWHQGAVFPWLFGAYVDAIFRVHGRISRAYARAEACLGALLQEHLREGCLAQISECFNGTAPHSPQGSFAHVAAVGEVIRAYLEVKGRIW